MFRQASAVTPSALYIKICTKKKKKGWNHECVHVTVSGPELICFKTKWPELNRVEKQLSLQGNIKGFARHPSGPFQEHRLQTLGGNVLTVLRSGETDFIQPRLVAEMC